MRIILLIAILFIGCISGSKVAETSSIAIGDTVSLNYIAEIKDSGLVFDTSYESVARDAKIPKIEGFKPKASYEPIDFIVGEGLIMPAFEEALIGMKVGEEKTVVVPPHEGYGERNESLVISMSRFVIIPREAEMSLESFKFSYNKEPVLNDTVEDIYWNSRVIRVNDTVVVRHEPPPNLLKETLNGKIKVDSNETSVIVEYIPVLNVTFQNSIGNYVTVVHSNQTSMTVDYNHPLAGKTLIFQIKVEKIIKASAAK